MDATTLALRVLLAAVFAVAGFAKLRDRDGSRQALTDFGVPGRLVPLGAIALPLAELAIAGLLLFPGSARAGAVAAALLLAAFVAAIANAIANGRAPDCHCFGQLHSEPAGRTTLVRNAILIAVAVFVALAGPGPAIDGWVADRSASELGLLAATLAAAGVGAWQLSAWEQRRARARRKRHAIAQLAASYQPSGPPLGSPAPDFTVHNLDGAPSTLTMLRERGLPVVIVFIHPTCAPCRRLLPTLSQWRDRLRDSVTIAVISDGEPADNRVLVDESGLVELLLQREGNVYHAFELRHGTPCAIAVDADGTIATDGVAGEAAIEELVRVVVRRSEQSRLAPAPA